MATTSTRWLYLERDPHSSCRQLSIKGRRIKARTIYGRYINVEAPMTPEQIAADRDLPIEAVKEAITYCESDPWEIQQDRLQEEALIEANGMNHPQYKWKPNEHYRPIPPEERDAIRRHIDALKPTAVA